jgi:anti-sigma factor (TIGR02949 family)
MIGCHDAVRQLWEYLDGTLGAGDHDRVDEHLARCLRCCGELEFAHELRRLLREGRDVSLPADSLERLYRTVDGLEEQDR